MSRLPQVLVVAVGAMFLAACQELPVGQVGLGATSTPTSTSRSTPTSTPSSTPSRTPGSVGSSTPTPTGTPSRSVAATGAATPGTTTPGSQGGSQSPTAGSSASSGGTDSPTSPVSESTPPGTGGDPADGPRGAGTGLGVPGAPRVFMAMHGSNALANDPSKDAQWSYVRSHLDGIWGNNAKMSVEEQARLWRKVATRNLVSVQALHSKLENPGNLSKVAEVDKSLAIKREAISLYTSKPQEWTGKTIAGFAANYVTNPNVAASQRYTEVWTGWSMHNWVTKPTGAAGKAIDESAGVFVECGAGVCTAGPRQQNLVLAITEAHAQGKHFMWFANTQIPLYGTSGALGRFQSTYNMLRSKGLWRTNDVVMLINYQGKYKDVPETVDGQPADTITGMLYWALQQQR